MFDLIPLVHLQMKKLLFFYCLFACTLPSFGQAYQLMYSNRLALYTDPQGNLSVYKPDFVMALGSDTVMKNYSHLDDSTLNPPVMNGYYCATRIDCFGSQIYVKNGPVSYILTGRGDSLALQTISQTGDQWILTAFSNGNHIRAQVVANTPDTVFGFADTLKYISLQMEDSLNNQLSHPVNSLYFEISEQFGLYRFPNLRNFPDINRMYQLVGIDSALQAGRSRPRPETIYNYDVGDIFHFRHNWFTLNYGHWDYTKRTVLSKIVQPLSVEYTFFDSSLFITDGFMAHSERFDTATVSTTIGFDTWDCSQVFNSLPYLVYGNTYQYWYSYSCANRTAAILFDALPEYSSVAIRPFPNPFSSHLRLSLPEATYGNLSLLDCFGKEVMKLHFQGAEIDLPTQQIPGGLYLLRIECQGRMRYWKVVKE
ncbi:MAG: T9SS type A sorting domain-containing protein [Bacteroidetes bacterium]|nr:T9SS type A sorting domain-containing protein [Bacteroidota bacterium]